MIYLFVYGSKTISYIDIERYESSHNRSDGHTDTQTDTQTNSGFWAQYICFQTIIKTPLNRV